MFCPKCGKENKDAAKFCVGCGAPLGRRAPQAAPSYQAGSMPGASPSGPARPVSASAPSLPRGLNGPRLALLLIDAALIAAPLLLPWLEITLLFSSQSMTLLDFGQFANTYNAGTDVTVLIYGSLIGVIVAAGFDFFADYKNLAIMVKGIGGVVSLLIGLLWAYPFFTNGSSSSVAFGSSASLGIAVYLIILLGVASIAIRVLEFGRRRKA